MKSSLLITVATVAFLVPALGNSAKALERCACRRASGLPWQGGYYNISWGMPVALVVPPTVEFQTHWGWGVGNTRATSICPLFQRNWPGPGHYDRAMFKPTPHWPSDTDQFGIHYIRGPW